MFVVHIILSQHASLQANDPVGDASAGQLGHWRGKVDRHIAKCSNLRIFTSQEIFESQILCFRKKNLFPKDLDYSQPSPLYPQIL
jgi:hypothetical protein